MSFYKTGRVLPKKVTGKMIATMVANALREAHQNDSSIAKQIGRKTGANLHTISKWLNALYAPKSVHLIALAQHYPKVMGGIIQLAGYEVDLTGKESPSDGVLQRGSQVKSDTSNSIYRDKYVPVNVSVPMKVASYLNARQLWFLGKLQSGEELKSSALAIQWVISHRTAKRDIQQLVALDLIRFSGACKNGYYVLN